MSDSDIQRTLGRLEAQNEAIIKLLEQNKRDHEKTEERLSILERKIAYGSGAIGLFTFIWPLLIKYVQSA